MTERIISKRSLVAVALLFALTTISIRIGSGEASGTTRTAKVGKSYTLRLEGTPGAGYLWRYNSANSANGSILNVTPLGYGKPTGGMIGGAASYIFQITPLSSGRAKLVFDYVRRWEGIPVRHQEHRVDVQP